MSQIRSLYGDTLQDPGTVLSLILALSTRPPGSAETDGQA
jgi:hypothetical protein